MQKFHLSNNKYESVVFNMFYILYITHLATSVWQYYLPVSVDLLLTSVMMILQPAYNYVF